MLKNIINSTAKLIVVSLALILLISLNFYMWKKDRMHEQTIINLQNELVLQQQENANIALINDKLKRKINSLKQGSLEMIEEEARSGFGMVGEGETFFHFENKKQHEVSTRKTN